MKLKKQLVRSFFTPSRRRAGSDICEFGSPVEVDPPYPFPRNDETSGEEDDTTSTTSIVSLDHRPRKLICPYCNYRGRTMVFHERGDWANNYLACILCCIPYAFLGWSHDTYHNCALCGRHIGYHKGHPF